MLLHANYFNIQNILFQYTVIREIVTVILLISEKCLKLGTL